MMVWSRGHRKRLTRMITIGAICTVLGIALLNLFQRAIGTKNGSENTIDTSQIGESDTCKLRMTIGILSGTKNQDNRNALRETWISKLNADGAPYRVTYMFMLSEPSVELENERNKFNDIVYLNISDEGYNYKASEKLYTWFKYIHKHIPETDIGVRMDDDVYLCVPQVLNRIALFDSKTLYYGYMPFKGLIDELFVVLGKALINRIAKRTYCFNQTNCRPDVDLVEETRLSGASLSLQTWVNTYDDVNFKSDNANMVQRFRGRTAKAVQYGSMINATFCDNWFLFHKASPHIMRKIHNIVNL